MEARHIEDKDFDHLKHSVGADLSSPSKRTRKAVQASTAQLCERCAKIDLDNMLSTTWFPTGHKTLRGDLKRHLGSACNWDIGSCPLCTLLSETIPLKTLGNKRSKYDLGSFDSKSLFRMRAVDIRVISLNESGEYLVPQQETPVIRIIKPDSIDFGIPKAWLRFCREMHTKSCATKATTPVPSMSLINCETGKIVPADSHPYVALSYVCGLNLRTIGSRDSLPQNLPATIADSISVTKSLGLRYLWIDQYCIDQGNERDFLSQLLRMDAIYQNSDVTIVAVGGQDGNYGLPGVGRRHRRKQASGSVGKHFLISTMNSPGSLVENSKWITRGWTYQEGLLSKRRLVFTDEQIYYECHGMHCCETLDMPLQDMHIKSQQRFRMEFCQQGSMGVFPHGIGRGPWEILERIEEYSQRSLTKQSDVLNGILGILRVFEEGSFSVRHCLGVPILPKTRELLQKRATSPWNPITGLLMGLCWNLRTPSLRHAGFPSWSWTGWPAPVTWHVHDIEMLVTDPNTNLEFELNDGSVVDYDTFQTSYNELSSTSALSGFIHISAWTSSIHVLESKCTSRSECQHKVKIDLEDEEYLHWEYVPTIAESLSKQEEYVGIHLGTHPVEDSDYAERTGPALLVVSKSDNCMERVGFGWIDQFDTIYKADGTEYEKECLLMNPRYARRPALIKSWQKIRLG